MNSNAPFSVDRHDRLAEVLDAYLAAQEAGTPPDVDEFLARYPELAGELRECLASLAFIRRAGNLSVAGETPAEGEAAGGVLGDFRIVREVGRGGMGVVYEAEQISLRRHVALKVLPFAATMDPRHLQRFHNEAQAAACLHHTNIVPVYFVGCERGVHFYAMQFIDGQPFSETIRQLCRLEKKAPSAGEVQRIAYQPAPDGGASTPVPAAAITPLTAEGRRSREYYRKVAELGVQAAEALDHAHQLGIVHRDIKPGNLLLDGRGNVWVTDFGLAHMQQGEASLTGTGQMVGTPRYMSPEQALAKRAPIDHRTDIYSLGATLYELLTLRPAFASEDRQELLRQIAFEEPPRPRRLERAIPAELEIIVLRSMEKRPQDRYATAQELADDLERWLKHEPIRARRPSYLQVARKWARRHRSAVWTAAVPMLILMTLGILIGFWWMQKHTAAETEARVALREAKQWQQDEKWPEALSAVRRAQTVLRGFGFNAGLRQQVDELGKDLEMVQRLEEARLKGTVGKDGNFDFKGIIAAYVEAFAWYGLDVEHGDDVAAAEFIRSRSITMQLIGALDDLAYLQRTYRKNQNWKHLLTVARAVDANEWRNRLRDAWERLDGDAMHDLLASAEVRDVLTTTQSLLHFSVRGHRDVSHKLSAALLRRAQQRYPSDFWINHDLAVLLIEAQPPQLEEAIRHFMIAVALRPQSSGAHHNLGNALRAKGQLDEAIAEYREAIRINKDEANSYHNIGLSLVEKGQLDEAIIAFREAIRIKMDYADAHNSLGNVLRETGQVDEAIAEFHEAIRIKKDDAFAHNNLANALVDKGRLDEAIAEYNEAIRIRTDYSAAYRNLGNALNAKGQLDEAIVAYRKAIGFRKDYAAAHTDLGNALRHKGQLDNAIAEYQKAIQIDKDYPYAHCSLGNVLAEKGQIDKAIEKYHEAIRLKHDFAVAHYDLGIALAKKEELDKAIAEYREAIRFKKDYAEAHCNLGDLLEQTGRFSEALEYRRRGHELGSKDPRWRYPSARWVRNCERLVELDGKLTAILSGQKQPANSAERLALARLCQMPYKKRHADAVRLFRDAFAGEPIRADDLNAQDRYNAACAAALAGRGQGVDGDKLDSKERARFRQQAIDWLRADLKAYRQLLDKSAGKVGPEIARRMQHWLRDADYAGVRSEAALAQLPDDERRAWRKLWADVAELLAKAQGKAPAEKKPDTK